MKWPLGAALLVLAVAGCASPPAPQAPEPTEIVNDLTGYVDPFIMDHDHADASLHAYAFHARQLFHHRLGGDSLTSSGAHAVDVRGDWLFVAAYGATVDTEGGVYVFDIKDREKPVLAGQFNLPGALAGDRSMEATDDGNWIVLGTEAISCANHVNPFAPGLYLLDARDKSDIKQADYLPSRGVHSVATYRMGTTDYVVTLGGTDVNSRNILKIENGKFVGVGRVVIRHDITIFDDPILGHPLLLAANVEELRIFDFSNPADPKLLSNWERPDSSVYVHAATVNITEGQRIIVLESEDWDDEPSPVWVLNATEIDHPELMATWVNPAEAPANAGIRGTGGTGSLAFSTHNPRFENGILHLAHYHGGAWMLDMRTLAKAAKPEVMAYFLPHDADGYKPGSTGSVAPEVPFAGLCFSGFSFAQVPLVMDLEAKDGVVYVADVHTGLYAYRWDPDVIVTP